MEKLTEKVKPRKSLVRDLHRAEAEKKMESTESDLSDWECRKFGNINLKSPPLVHHDDDSSNSDNPHLTPSKRKYPNSFNKDFTTENELDSKKKSMEGFHFNKENIPTNWNNSLTTSRDSALGGSLISAYGSVLTDSSSSLDAHSNSESETISNLSSPTHSTYGRYRKIYGSGSESTENGLSDTEVEEVLVLHRLPGENLGMILGIEGDKTKEHISTVRVKSVTIGGAAYRATGGSSGINVGDEVLEVNGLDLKTLSHDECVTVFKEMPLRVILKIHRGKTKKRQSSFKEGNGVQKSFVKRYVASESEDDSHDGFVPLQFEIDKDPKESLGLSIVPSYGSTRQYFQIKRLLPSGAASRSKKLKVGDRIVSCNGINLRGVNQSKCLSILKSEANNGDFEIGILRPVENDIPTEFSLTVSNGHHSESNLVLRSPQHSKTFSDNPFDSESDPEVVLNSFQNFDNLFASNTVKLSYQKPVRKPSQQTNDTSDASSDLDSSFEKDFNLNRAKTSKMTSEEWSFALPPPAEFSDTPENGQEGDEQIPVTSIDDVLNEYSPTCSNMNTPIHQPKSISDESMKIIESIVGLEDDNNVSSEFPLTQIEESPLEHTNNGDNDHMIENSDFTDDNHSHGGLYKEDSKTNYLNSNGDLSIGQQTKDDNSNWQLEHPSESTEVNFKQAEKKSKNYMKIVGKVHQFYYNSSDSMSASENDDEIIQPVKVKKEISVPDYLMEPTKSGNPVVEEDAIAPAIVQRENKLPVSAKIELNAFVETKKEEKHAEFPHPAKSSSPPLPEVKKNKHLPPTANDFNGEEIVETFVPVQVKKEEYSKILEEKLGGNIEEEIVPTEVKRENSFGDNVQLLMMTNRWANSAKDKKSGDITFSGLVPQVKKSEVNTDQTLKEKPSEIQERVSKETYSKREEPPAKEAEPTDFNETGEKMSVNNSVENEKSKEEIKAGDYKTEISVNTQIKADISVPPEQKVESEKPQADDQKQEKTEPDTKSTTVHKTTVAVTTSSQGIVGTIQSTTSATIKPLSAIKPLSFNTLSLNRPNRYTTTINTGSKPSLLSTIYSKTHAPSANVRTEEQSFLVSVMKGILGLGMKVAVLPEGYVQVTEIQPSGPVAKDGNIRVGDYILSINSTELTGLPDHKVQQIIRLLPRGLAKLVISVTPPDITKIEHSSTVSRPPDLSINTGGYTSPRRLTPALSPKSSGDKTTVSPRNSYTSATTKPLSPVITKPLSPALSPTLHQTKPLSPTMSPTSQRSPIASSPKSPGLSPALAPRKFASEQQTTNKPVAVPRQTVKHDDKEPIKPVNEVMSSVETTETKKAPPPVAPKPKPRSLPQQTETATHHKITPNIGGYVSSAMGQLKNSNIPASDNKEQVIKPSNVDYVSSARKASHSTDDKQPIDTVIFASIPSKTDYVSSARKTFEEPKLIPSGVVDYVTKEKPKPVERQKPAAFQVLSTTGSTEGGVKIAPVRLNSALSPRKTKTAPDNNNSFNFNAKFSYEEKALPRTGYFVGKPDVVTSPKDTETSHDENISKSPVPSPRSVINNSVSPRSDDSQDDVVACAQVDDMSTNHNNLDSSRSESVTSPILEQDSLSSNDLNVSNEEKLEESFDTEFVASVKEQESKLSDDLDSSDKHLKDADAFGLVHEGEIVSDIVNSQETLPNNDIFITNNQSDSELHEESENVYLHDGISTGDAISITNILEKKIDQGQMEFDQIDSAADNGTEINEEIQMDSQINLESQGACTNVVDDFPDGMIDKVVDNIEVENQNSDVQLNTDSETISFMQEPLGSEDQPISAIVADDSLNVDTNVDNTFNTNQDNIDALVIDSVPPEFSDGVDIQLNSDIHHQEQVDSTNISLDNSASSEVIYSSTLPSYCVKFPPINNSDDDDIIIISSQRPFSIICGEQTFSVNTKSNTLAEIVQCDLLVSTKMLSDDLQLANQKMDSLGRPNEDCINVILIQRDDCRIPIGLNLCPETNGGMVISELDPAGLLYQRGQVKPGDTILLINGEIVSRENADAILQSLENSESHLVCVVISPSSKQIQSKGDNQTEKLDSPTSDENANKKIVTNAEELNSESGDDILHITMVKGVTGLGFLIEGGLGSPRGDVPVKIKRMFKGGAAAKCGLLKVGDELVQVNGKNMSEMKHTEAWNFLKFLDDGDVKLSIRRQPE